MTKAETGRQRWEYKDAAGVIRRGVFQSAYTGQGTDIAYFFKRDDNTIDVISGKRLNTARKLDQ